MAKRLDWRVAKSKRRRGAFQVGAVDVHSDGEVYVATFAGVGAEERALEYALWKNLGYGVQSRKGRGVE